MPVQEEISPRHIEQRLLGVASRAMTLTSIVGPPRLGTLPPASRVR
ncbi:MAG: hypothetical protein R3B90_19185 [Planctomycetaceae bacterium]